MSDMYRGFRQTGMFCYEDEIVISLLTQPAGWVKLDIGNLLGLEKKYNV